MLKSPQWILEKWSPLQEQSSDVFNQFNFAKCSSSAHAWAAAQRLSLKGREEIKMNDDKMSTWVEKQNSLKAPGQELTQFN